MKLVLGCGPHEKKDDVVTVDIIKGFKPDIVADIRKGFSFGKFDEIEAHHILEHVQLNEDFKRVMNSIWENLNIGGTVDITVPYYKSELAYDSYEHTRYFNENSFLNFYDNRYSEEMGLKQFKKVMGEIRPKDYGEEVHIILQK